MFFKIESIKAEKKPSLYLTLVHQRDHGASLLLLAEINEAICFLDTMFTWQSFKTKPTASLALIYSRKESVMPL